MLKNILLRLGLMSLILGSIIAAGLAIPAIMALFIPFTRIVALQYITLLPMPLLLIFMGIKIRNYAKFNNPASLDSFLKLFRLYLIGIIVSILLSIVVSRFIAYYIEKQSTKYFNKMLLERNSNNYLQN